MVSYDLAPIISTFTFVPIKSMINSIPSSPPLKYLELGSASQLSYSSLASSLLMLNNTSNSETICSLVKLRFDRCKDEITLAIDCPY